MAHPTTATSRSRSPHPQQPLGWTHETLGDDLLDAFWQATAASAQKRRRLSLVCEATSPALATSPTTSNQYPPLLASLVCDATSSPMLFDEFVLRLRNTRDVPLPLTAQSASAQAAHQQALV